jgi:macrolide transport system ATP-binding/permease protein
MALRALRANVLRTVLTLLGIVIGVGSVVAMLAIGEGSKQQVIAQIGQMGTNLLSVRPQFRNARGYTGPIATLTPEDAKAIGMLPDVKSSMPDIQGGNSVRYGNIDYQTTITATTEALSETRSWPVARGIFFNADDEISYTTVAVLGQTVVDALFPDGSDPIGKYILIKNVPFQVIGVMSRKGATAGGNDTDDVVFVPLTTGMLRIFGQRFVRTITVAVSDLAKMDAVQDSVTSLLKERHNGASDFQIRNMADVLETATVAQNTMTVLLGSVAAISLLVGGIGIMNIMLVSVTERTHEIGIRMATGARQRDILQQFLSEAVVVSGVGGLAGVAAGIAAGYIIQAFGNPIAFTMGPMLLAFCCAAATGLIFGYAPARKAANLDPVVALSNE